MICGPQFDEFSCSQKKPKIRDTAVGGSKAHFRDLRPILSFFFGGPKTVQKRAPEKRESRRIRQTEEHRSCLTNRPVFYFLEPFRQFFDERPIYLTQMEVRRFFDESDL